MRNSTAPAEFRPNGWPFGLQSRCRLGTFEPAKNLESGEVLALGNPAGVERPSTPLKARWRIVAADTCELCATRQKVKASAICFVLPSRLPLELGGEGSADKYHIYTWELGSLALACYRCCESYNYSCPSVYQF